MDHNKPIFGICGGLQAINVFMGGTLKKVEDVDAHQNYEKSNHIIDIKEGSFVHDVFKSKEALINSYHSWAIDKLAPGLEAVAWTKDGIIEAVESKEKRIFDAEFMRNRFSLPFRFTLLLQKHLQKYIYART